MIKTKLIPALAVALATLPGAAFAAGGETHIEDVSFSFEGPFGTYDAFQLQRGFQIYQNVCAGCHGLRYVAFRDLGDPNGPAFPVEQVKAIAASFEVADEEGEPGDTRPGEPSDLFPPNTSVGAPDLSLMAKARAGFHGPAGLGINQLLKGTGGAEYIYSLLTGYTGEEVEQAGSVLYKNTAFAGGQISMAQPLFGEDVEYGSHGGAHDSDGQDHDKDHAYTPPAPTLEQEAEDVAAFLMWAAEPKMTERKEAGLRNILFLIFLTVLLYFTNKKLWAPVKGKD